jgi:siroheme synthase (precorrin-2 oxidase/ferrochelatase)
VDGLSFESLVFNALRSFFACAAKRLKSTLPSLIRPSGGVMFEEELAIEEVLNTSVKRRDNRTSLFCLILV